LEAGENIPEEHERAAAETQLAQPSFPKALNAPLPILKKSPSPPLDVSKEVIGGSTLADFQIVGDLSVPEIIYSADGSIAYRVEISFQNGESKYISRRYSEVTFLPSSIFNLPS